jgi:hypothetical protein
LSRNTHGGRIVQGKPSDPWASSAVFYAPKAAAGLSPGFQPWDLKINEFALKLKGRKADLIKLA